MEYVAVRDGTKDGQRDLPDLYPALVTQSHRRNKTSVSFSFTLAASASNYGNILAPWNIWHADICDK